MSLLDVLSSPQGPGCASYALDELNCLCRLRAQMAVTNTLWAQSTTQPSGLRPTMMSMLPRLLQRKLKLKSTGKAWSARTSHHLAALPFCAGFISQWHTAIMQICLSSVKLHCWLIYKFLIAYCSFVPCDVVVYVGKCWLGMLAGDNSFTNMT